MSYGPNNPRPSNEVEPRKFRSEDLLSYWTEELAHRIPYPSMQFDIRHNSHILHSRSSLYWSLIPSGWIGMDVYTSDIQQLEPGCVVFLIAPYSDVQELHIINNNYDVAVEGFNEAVTCLPEGLRLRTSEEPPPLHRGRGRKVFPDIDDRQLIDLGRQVREARTGSIFEKNTRFAVEL